MTFKTVQVRVLYSVAVDYGNTEDYIREPECLLFDIIASLQAAPVVPNYQQAVFQFELYQSSKKPGNFLSLVRDPFEGGQYKMLFDGRAEKDIKGQIVSLLERQLKLPRSNYEHPVSIKLFKCMAKECGDIMFGSFPSQEMHTAYCATPDKGCDNKPIIVTREEMKKYFSTIP